MVAVDAEQEALDRLDARLPKGAAVRSVCARFEDFPLGRYDVVIAGFSLFFLNAHQFGEFWPRLVAAILPGGLFAGQLLGVRDEWAERGYSTHTADDVHRLLGDFEILYFEEVERDGETAVRTPKHWHVFHVVARKRA